MKSPKQHILFILGILCVFTSFLFFGRQTDIYTILLFGGLVMTGVGFGFIVFGRSTIKSKVFWTLILFLSILLEQVSEPVIIKGSFLIYVKTNQNDLEEINDLLICHKGTLYMYADTITAGDMELTEEETIRLAELKRNVDAYMIVKSTTDIYYGLFGFLDIRHGVWYSKSGKKRDFPKFCV